MTNHETPAEVLADIARRIVDNAMPATDSGATCFVPRYQIDQLSRALEAERSLAAGKVVATVLHPDPEFPSPGPLFSREDWRRLVELPAGTKLYTAPPADPAKASGSAPDGWRPTRDQITSACEAYASGGQDFRTSIERALIAAKTATPPASAPEVTESMVERACEEYLQEAKRQNFNPSEAWARSQQARDWMRAALTAALQQEGKSHG